jgi:hypothetical protein
MRVTTQSFWLPKSGNAESEYEDAFCPEEAAAAVPLNGFRCAVADGATETSFSGAWANLLTRRWCEVQDINKFLEILPILQAEWASQIESVPLAWYAEEKARAGAYSSLLGLAFSEETAKDDNQVGWRAVAVGDSCLFQITNGDVKSFPLSRSEDFNSRPFLLSTTPLNADELAENLLIENGSCTLNDVFYLMTDALACWFLRRQEEGQDIAESLLDLDSPEMFQRIVEGQRVAKDTEGQPYLRNDDVTLLRLVIRE